MLVVLRTRAWPTRRPAVPRTRSVTCASSRSEAPLREDAVVLGDNLRLAGRRGRPLRCSSARAARTRSSRSRSVARAVRVQQEDMEGAATPTRSSGRRPRQRGGLAGLGDVALIRGDLGRGRAALRAGRGARRTDAAALSKLGVVRVRSGRPGAIALFAGPWRATRRTRGPPLPRGALASNGRAAEAVPYFERALAAGPARRWP